MQKLISKFKNSYIRLFILLISSLCLGFMLTTMPKETPFWIIQIVGVVYFLEAISYIMDIHTKIMKNKIAYLDSQINEKLNPIKNKLRWAVQHFFTSEEEDKVEGRPTMFQLGITDYQIQFNKKNEIELTITLFRPGILIGRQGKQFDEFKAYLSRITEHNVSIKILEPTFLRFEKEADV